MKVKYLLIGILFLSACNGRLDEMRPHNMAEADNYLSSFNNIVNATSGLYGQFQSAAGGYTEVSLYHVAYHVLGEFRANNVIFNDAFLSWSTDYLRGPDAHFFLNSDQKSQSYAWSVWAKSHQLILGASRNIVAIDKLYANTVNPDEKLNLVRLKGENAFLRGLLIFNATNVFGRPFWDQPDKNLGIPLDVEATAQALERSSVRECFEQAIADFKTAAACLPDERSDRTFANKAASFGMLSRIYLYMGGMPESPVEDYNRMAVRYADSTFSMKNDVVEVLQGEELKDLYDNPKPIKRFYSLLLRLIFPAESTIWCIIIIRGTVMNLLQVLPVTTVSFRGIMRKLWIRKKICAGRILQNLPVALTVGITLKNIMAESMRHFPVTTALPVRLCLSGPGK